jgi:F0F1-type ATP synthase assembly protein I
MRSDKLDGSVIGPLKIVSIFVSVTMIGVVIGK